MKKDVYGIAGLARAKHPAIPRSLGKSGREHDCIHSLLVDWLALKVFSAPHEVFHADHIVLVSLTLRLG